jgi:hypothetical protein
MNRFRQALVWLSRLTHCRGFGIQSPTDYRFVRYVINEHWPYYAYEQLDKPVDNWLQRKLGHLYFRLANERQPHTIVDWVGCQRYLQAGCLKARIVDEAKDVELAVVSVQTDYHRLFQECNDQSVVVFQDIYRYPEYWHCIEHDPRVTVTFDLYYCGIVMFDPKRPKQNYIINF